MTPTAFGSKFFDPTQTKMSIYAKECLSIYLAFVEFGVEKYLSSYRVHRRYISNTFCPTKLISPALWNASYYILQYNFVIAHMAELMNTAADLEYCQ